jgi:hypothetical protein
MQYMGGKSRIAKQLAPRTKPMSTLLELEQLPDWKHETLMAWVMGPAVPPGLGVDCDASSLLTLREMQLVGRLALCVEQALALEDGRTARQVLRLACQTWVKIRGAQVLKTALENVGDGAEGDWEEEEGPCS